MAVAQCRLCRERAQLRDSHIIPEFFYAGAYDDKHRALELKLDLGRERQLQKGYREPLLCDDCEESFGRLEKYFKEQWYDGGLLPDRLDAPRHQVIGLDYTRTRLLHLSILWRASVSQHSMFRNVSLGPLEGTLCEMLLADDPGKPHEFHWTTNVLVLEGTVLDGFIFEPTAYRLGGRHIYMFTYGGCAWFFVASREPVRSWLPLALTLEGSQWLIR